MIPTLREVAASATPARGVIRHPRARSLASKDWMQSETAKYRPPPGEAAEVALDAQATRSLEQGIA